MVSLLVCLSCYWALQKKQLNLSRCCLGCGVVASLRFVWCLYSLWCAFCVTFVPYDVENFFQWQISLTRTFCCIQLEICILTENHTRWKERRRGTDGYCAAELCLAALRSICDECLAASSAVIMIIVVVWLIKTDILGSFYKSYTRWCHFINL